MGRKTEGQTEGKKEKQRKRPGGDEAEEQLDLPGHIRRSSPVLAWDRVSPNSFQFNVPLQRVGSRGPKSACSAHCPP